MHAVKRLLLKDMKQENGKQIFLKKIFTRDDENDEWHFLFFLLFLKKEK